MISVFLLGINHTVVITVYALREWFYNKSEITCVVNLNRVQPIQLYKEKTTIEIGSHRFSWILMDSHLLKDIFFPVAWKACGFLCGQAKIHSKPGVRTGVVPTVIVK